MSRKGPKGSNFVRAGSFTSLNALVDDSENAGQRAMPPLDTEDLEEEHYDRRTTYYDALPPLPPVRTRKKMPLLTDSLYEEPFVPDVRRMYDGRMYDIGDEDGDVDLFYLPDSAPATPVPSSGGSFRGHLGGTPPGSGGVPVPPVPPLGSGLGPFPDMKRSLRRRPAGMTGAAAVATAPVVAAVPIEGDTLPPRPKKRDFSGTTNAELRGKLDKLVDELFAEPSLTKEQVEDAAKKHGVDGLTPPLNAAALVGFIKRMKDGKAKVSAEDATLVGLVVGANDGDLNHLDFVRDASKAVTTFVAQRILLKNTEALIKDQGVKLLKQMAPGEQAGLGKAYSEVSRIGEIDWLALGTATRFEQVVHAQHDKSKGDPRKNLDSYSDVTYTQFASFTRNSVELDIAKEREDIDDIRASSLSPEEQEEQIKPHQARIDRQYLTEAATLFGSLDRTGNVKADFTRGLSQTNSAGILFVKLAEDTSGIRKTVIDAHQRVFDDDVENRQLVDPDQRNRIFTLSTQKLSPLIAAVKGQSATSIADAERIRQVREAVPLHKINAARAVVAGYLEGGALNWHDTTRITLNNEIDILTNGTDDEKQRLVEKYLAIPINRDNLFDPVVAAPDLQAKVRALVDINRDRLRTIALIYKFITLEGWKTFDDLTPSNTTFATPGLYEKDGEKTMRSSGITGTRVEETDAAGTIRTHPGVEVTDTGLVIQVFKKNAGYEEQYRQFRALGDGDFSGEPICVLSRFDDRESGLDGMPHSSENKYCLTTISAAGATNTYITEATFKKLEDLSAEKFKLLAGHMAKVEGLKQIKNLMLVAAGDLYHERRMDEGRALVKRAKIFEQLVADIEFTDSDNAESRQEKIDRLNRFFSDQLTRRQDEIARMFDGFDDTNPPQPSDIEEFNKFLLNEGIFVPDPAGAGPNDGVVFSATDSWNQIIAKKLLVEQHLADNKERVTEQELPADFAPRVKEINDQLLSGTHATEEMKAKAKGYASHAVQQTLSNQAAQAMRNSNMRIRLDKSQVDDFIDRFSGRFELDREGRRIPKPIHTGVDGSLWMNATNKSDLETLLTKAEIPVSPVPGISIFKPRLNERGAIKFKDKSKNLSNAQANFASVCFTADEDGNFTGDDTAYICLPGENVYIKVMVARIDGVDSVDKKTPVKKGQVTIYSDQVFFKDANGIYTGVSTETALIKDSPLTKRFGKEAGDRIRKAAEKFSIVATSVCGNERGSVAVMMNGHSMENHNYNQRLSPFRDPKEPDRNISATFELDANGIIKADNPLPSHTSALLPGREVIARRCVEVEAFKKSEDDPDIVKDFKVVLRISAVKKDATEEVKLVKSGFFIETINEKGEVQYKPLTKEELQKVYTKSDDEIEEKITEIKEHVKTHDVAVAVKTHAGKDEIKVLRSTDKDTTWYGGRKYKDDEKVTDLKQKETGGFFSTEDVKIDPSSVVHPIEARKMEINPTLVKSK